MQAADSSAFCWSTIASASVNDGAVDPVRCNYAAFLSRQVDPLPTATASTCWCCCYLCQLGLLLPLCHRPYYYYCCCCCHLYVFESHSHLLSLLPIELLLLLDLRLLVLQQLLLLLVLQLPAYLV
jgi:hypothetical protein